MRSRGYCDTCGTNCLPTAAATAELNNNGCSRGPWSRPAAGTFGYVALNSFFGFAAAPAFEAFSPAPFPRPFAKGATIGA